MRRLVVLVLLAGCWLPVAGWLQAGPAMAGSAMAGSAVSPAVSPAAASGPGGGAWGWPVDGSRAVSRPFAPPASRYGAGHRGADLVSAPGAVVRAAGAGRVSYAGLLAGRGVVVVVHGALRTTYEPVTAAVRVGSEVVRGQPLGRLDAGHAACPTPACLHWGLRRGEDYLDPVRLVEQGPVRLLPLGPGVTPRRPGTPGPPAGAAARAGARVPPPRTVSGAPALGPARLRPVRERQAPDPPTAVAAAAALVVGTALLVRPHPVPPGPAVPSAAARPAAGPAPEAAHDLPHGTGRPQHPEDGRAETGGRTLAGRRASSGHDRGRP